MNRLQKKCFIASTGFHLLLASILVVGPAFLSSPPKPDNTPLLDFVAVATVDEAMSGGGNPQAKPISAPAPQKIVQPAPQPAPPPPQPRHEPEPVKVHEPEPAREPVKDLKNTTDPDAVEPTKVHKPHKPEVSVTPVKRTAEPRKKVTEPSEDDTRAREVAENRRLAAANFIDRTARNLRGTASSSTTIDLPGPGGGGVPYANWLQAVKTVYSDAWNIPDGVTDDDATVAASVTIARDGSVLSARIVRSSGNSEVDRSVQTTLDRIRFAARLPESSKEDQRSVTINFNVRAKRGLG